MRYREREDEKKPDDTDDVNKVIDEIEITGQSPSEQQRIKDNRRFIRTVAEKPLPKNKEKVRVFGVQDVNINACLKENIWNRGIFTTDHLCRVVFQLRYEQIRKWLAQKRKKPFEHWMLILLIIGVAIALVVILLLMNMKIDFSHVFG
jgi:hypothetical protein